MSSTAASGATRAFESPCTCAGSNAATSERRCSGKTAFHTASIATPATSHAKGARERACPRARVAPEHGTGDAGEHGGHDHGLLVDASRNA